MLKLKEDVQCVLKDKKTGKEILEFPAQLVGDSTQYSASYEGGGVASGNQSMTIQTEKAYEYNALQHHVYIGGRRWVITSVTPSIRRKLGARMGAKTRVVYILNLE